MIEKLTLKFFCKKNIRKNIYIGTLILSLIFLGLSEAGIVTGTVALYVTLILIATDLVAYLYDPHPENPGFMHKLKHIADDIVSSCEDIDSLDIQVTKRFDLPLRTDLPIRIDCHSCGVGVVDLNPVA
jgi:hypothetical protein